jgi:hypothetical protein
MKINCPTEHQEQVGFCQWISLKFPGLLCFSIPNGEHRAISVAVRLKKEGLTRGIPDLFIPSLKIFIEMKRKDGGVVSKEQEKIIAYLQRVGYTVWVCHGAEEASLKLLTFLKERELKK